MNKKITTFIGAATCAGLIAIFVPGFAHEITAGVVPSTKHQTEIDVGGLAIIPPDAGCSQDPWPYGCNWGTPKGRKQIVKKGQARHHYYGLTTVRYNRVAVGGKL
jgi:hypothetical protein